MSTHNIGFYEDLTKIIFELSSNTHLISSASTSTCIHAILLRQQRQKRCSISYVHKAKTQISLVSH